MLAQNYPRIELLVRDDCSSDATADLISNMIPELSERLERVVFFKEKINIGLSRALVQLLAQANGKYFSVLGSDDYIFRYKTTIQVAYLESNPHCDGVFGNIEVLTGEEKILYRLGRKFGCYGFDDIFLFNYVLPAPSQLLRTEALRSINAYVEGDDIEDWSLWLKMTSYRGAPLVNLGIPLATYRRHDRNFSNDAQKMLLNRLCIIRRYSSHHMYDIAIANVFWLGLLESIKKSKRFTLEILRLATSNGPRQLILILLHVAPRYLVKKLRFVRFS